MNSEQSSEAQPEEEKYPWAGPALFTVVALVLFKFFWWLVTIGPDVGH
ncbi:hypothetical protein MNBD_GAMMA26-886 [hydrothermal vent metagenome]|uniref:Uncharacterized protein n=1 Tax=hydrothermal vent metagenome TaxID=652676 RepID=A0A3B1BAH6_9ZZZZ